MGSSRPRQEINTSKVNITYLPTPLFVDKVRGFTPFLITYVAPRLAPDLPRAVRNNIRVHLYNHFIHLTYQDARVN